MSEVFVGNSIVGNFEPVSFVKDIQGYEIEKSNDALYLVKEKERIKLKPLDDNSLLVLNNFSSEIKEFNPTIYKIEKNNSVIVIVLYVYEETIPLIGKSRSIHLYLRREIEKQLLNEGYRGYHVDSPNEIVELLNNLFINNKSIFVYADKKNKNSFTMYGKNCRARIQMERAGVYSIDNIYRESNKEYNYSLIQIFGDVNFILNRDSTSVDGAVVSSMLNVNVNEVFKAWKQYVEFENRLYEDDLKEKKFIKTIGFEINEDGLVFKLEDSQIVDENIEYEYISSYTLQGEIIQLPKTTDEILNYKKEHPENIVFLGNYINDIVEDKLVFEIPQSGIVKSMEKYKGILYISDHSLQIQNRRRNKVTRKISEKKNETANIIMRLSDPKVVDTQRGTNMVDKPITHDVKLKMFNNPNVDPGENTIEAMKIALNTPDIALIQGPPGTGKTTLIRGIVARLNSLNANYHILTSAEQHVALENVVKKLSDNKLIPPHIFSKKYNEEEEKSQMGHTIEMFQQNFIKLCEDLMRENKNTSSFSNNLTKVVYLIQQIRDNHYSKNFLNQKYNDLEMAIIDLGYTKLLEEELSTLQKCLVNKEMNDTKKDFSSEFIKRKIDSQRIDIEVYLEDDGVYQLKELQNLLEKYEYKELMVDRDLYELLINEDDDIVKENFELYIEYVKKLKEKFTPKQENILEMKEKSTKDIIENMVNKIYNESKKRPRDFYGIVENLCYRLNDIDSAANIIKKYTTVVGSTCAQAEKSNGVLEIKNDKYDYVIIDEAARANPLDIMIPMMMGTKVILVGDHKQLPHYIEEKYMKAFNNEQKLYNKEFDEKLLKKSLFEIIYENLEKAYNEGRIKFKRTIQINKQHRMHPTIGNFISDTFYESTIENGEKTQNKINDYNVLNGKNIAWLNVPYDVEKEETLENNSYKREAEADRIIDFIKELNKNKKDEKRTFNIGIISFYKGQIDLIRKKIKDNFSTSQFVDLDGEICSIEEMCNTVDSFQGKEFDIVIVSGVRSNRYIDPVKRLGFIHKSKSRINVALSRAKKLLVFVGDESTYSKNEIFEKYIDYVKKEGYYE